MPLTNLKQTLLSNPFVDPAIFCAPHARIVRTLITVSTNVTIFINMPVGTACWLWYELICAWTALLKGTLASIVISKPPVIYPNVTKDIIPCSIICSFCNLPSGWYCFTENIFYHFLPVGMPVFLSDLPRRLFAWRLRLPNVFWASTFPFYLGAIHSFFCLHRVCLCTLFTVDLSLLRDLF